MRVLFLSQIVPYPPHGGVLQRGYNLIRELGRQASVHLLAFVHPDELQSAAAIEDSKRALGAFCERIDYFPLWPKASPAHRALALAASACSPAPFSVIAHRSSAFARAVSDSLERTPADIIHVDTVALTQFVPWERRIPSVLTHHNIESMLMARRANVEKGRLAKRFLTREAAKLKAYESASARFDVNIMMSKPDEAALRAQVPGAATAVVPNGVDVEYFRPDPSQETPALIYTGGMNMFANKDAVLFFLDEIWPLVTAQVPNVEFYAVGQDPPRELHAFAERDPRVKVTGKVADIRPYVWKSSVYVVPLRVGGGTRLKVLDAMATGKAMVSTSIGCEGIDVQDGEHLLTADTPQAFADATAALLRDRNRRLALGRAARSLVERTYAWPVIARQLFGAYESARRRAQEAR
ncbi:MAG TPA: glycosyltransferase [Vicinamibacterales bacterium]|nr:glycosyltransferase [Vicinamibacterales bacterium]